MKGDWSFVGMGASGGALAAHGHLRGIRIAAWYDENPDIEAAVVAQGGLNYSGIFGEGLLPLPAMAQLPAELASAPTIVVSVTADQHERVAQRLAGVLTANHLVVLHCGYVGGGRIFERALEEAGCKERPTIVETINALHLCGKPNPGTVITRSHKQWLELTGATPADAEIAIRQLEQFWPELEIGTNALQSGLNNPNSLGHLPVMIGHLGLLSADHGNLTHGLLHFGEAYTDLIVNLAKSFEKERIEVIRRLGLVPLTVEEFDARAYPPGTRLDEVLRFGPKLQRRYITEDLPCDLVPFEELARLVACPTPLTTAMIDLAGAAFACDFRKTARTVDRLGIDWIRKNAPALKATKGQPS
ncbi:NAD/NADP octopine/nopaline dehydrogenase family protein [Pseudaminobacter soli (ex Li et al. 2025)]|uniref:Opine dehydrogenase domain-containing protein n=1 Tax=Pseudaminobacter soli (ex Li et al. 2025) TaxID=1295366 RepID=A0A2P7S301_9HYPH|nr:NAD/NADP octopine/nopaline dehydrogenase family protein [Mesorhizobium soli]PSJ56855.1 hypothetical protein C7I85_23505 [Mesorhizobium soli]